MKKIIIIGLLFILVGVGFVSAQLMDTEDPAHTCGEQPQLGSINQIKRGEVTWTFANPIPQGSYGLFATCDPWVSGSVVLDSVSPQTTISGGRRKHGSTLNPTLSGAQGYDNEFWGYQGSPCGDNHCYSDGLNIELQLPYTLNPGDALGSAVSKANDEPKSGLEEIQILTVLPTAPADGSFRPHFFGSDRTVKYNINMINWGALNNVPAPSGTDPFGNSMAGSVPSSAYIADQYKYPYYDVSGGYWSQRAIPDRNGYGPNPGYGEYAIEGEGLAAVYLNLDIPQSQKEQPLYNFLQRGIDIYEIYLATIGDDIRWKCGGGGHCHGRMFSMIFTGQVLGVDSMRDVRLDNPNRYYNEIRTTGYVNSGNANPSRGYDSQWFSNSWTTNIGGAVVNNAQYQTPQGIPAWAIDTPFFSNAHAGWNPHLDDAGNWRSYRTCCTTHSWAGTATAAKLMGLEDKINHPAFFDYTERYIDVSTQIHQHVVANNIVFPPGHSQAGNLIFGIDDVQNPEFSRNMFYEHWDTGFVQSVCGNGDLEGAEQCDDNNQNPGDGCNSECQLEECNIDSDCADDGLFCNGVPVCDQTTFQCVAGSNPCLDDGILCTVDCDEENDICPSGQLTDDTLCSAPDSSLCLLGRVCDPSNPLAGGDGCYDTYDVGSTCSDPNPCSSASTCDASGGCVGNPIPGCVVQTTQIAQWQNIPFDSGSQNGVFTYEFDAIPEEDYMDSVIALSSGAISAYSQYSAGIRFAPSGLIDVGGLGSSYSYDSEFLYAGGESYHFRIVVDTNTEYYDVYVSSQGGSEVHLAGGINNYPFRSSASSIDTLSFIAESHSAQIYNYGVSNGVQPSSCVIDSVSWNEAGTTVIEGDSVGITIEGTNCNVGEEVILAVYEYDPLNADDSVILNPVTAFFDLSGQATSSWIAEYQTDPGNNEFYVVASLASDSSVVEDSGQSAAELLSVTQSSTGGGGAIPKGVIPVGSGNPFYVESSVVDSNPTVPALNPVQCDLQDGEQCTVTWTVKATGNPGESYDVFVISDNDGVTVNSEVSVVTITDSVECVIDSDCADDGNVCTTEICNAGSCEVSFNTNPCSDGNLCTENDQCNGAGQCGGDVVMCNDGQSCSLDSCNTQTGLCEYDTSACECIVDSDCPQDGNVCTNAVCQSNTCVEQPVAAGTSCEDGNSCTQLDQCDGSGLCVGSDPVVCNDGLSCSLDSCNTQTGQCEYDPSGCECVVDSDCTDDGNVCTTAVCNAGSCELSINEGLVCDDLDMCTTTSSCNALGQCIGSDPVVCDDGISCTIDSCDSQTGQCTVNSAGCGCTSNADCADDGNVCTDEVCDLSTLTCVTQYNTNSCDDGSVCSQTDQCSEGVCVGGNILSCDNGMFCDGAEMCDDALGCVSGSAVTCRQGEVCDEGAQICAVPNVPTVNIVAPAFNEIITSNEVTVEFAVSNWNVNDIGDTHIRFTVDGGQIDYEFYNGASNVVNYNGVVAVDAYWQSATSITFTSLGLGPHTVQATLTDGSGNSESNSEASASIQFIMDPIGGTEASCGDGTCDASEDCNSCSADCGVCTTDTNPPSSGGSSGGGGGGGGSSSRNELPSPDVACTEEWVCGIWGACEDGFQRRVCVDIAFCDTIVDRPILFNSCDADSTVVLDDGQSDVLDEMPAPPAVDKNVGLVRNALIWSLVSGILVLGFFVTRRVVQIYYLKNRRKATLQAINSHMGSDNSVVTGGN